MSTIKVSNIQHGSAASAAITLDANGQATLNGLAFPTSGSLSGRNRIINGDMRIDQRNAGASVTPTDGQFTVDRWAAFQSTASKLSVQRSTTAPAGFTNSLLVTSLSAYTVAAADVYGLAQGIEGFNVADLGWGAAGAQSITISFWVRSSVTGTFGGVLRNNGGTRAYAFTYTVNAANTFEYKTVTIAGDTTGTWTTDNTSGIRLIFDLGTGSTFRVAAGSWSTGNYYGVSGVTSLVATNGATFYITGVQLEAGTVATPFERRSYGQELALCQRYFQTQRIDYLSYLGLYSSGANRFYGHPVSLMTEMRASPTISYSLITGANYWVNPGVSAHSADSTSGMTLYANTKSWRMSQLRQAGNSAAVGQTVYLWEAEFLITLSIEL